MRAVRRPRPPKHAPRPSRPAVVAAAGRWIGSDWARSPRSRLALEEPHLHAGELDHVVVVEAACLRTDGNAVDLRVVVFLAAVDVHDEVPFGAPRDRGDLHTGTAEGGERLGQFELSARKG